MSKFKIGDRVRTVQQNLPLYDLRDTGKILCYRKVDNMYLVRFDDQDGIRREHWLCEGIIELLKHKYPVIVITTDGVTTTATKRLGKRVLGTAYSKCAPTDKFDYDTGVGLALARLCGFEIKIHEEPKFPEKLVCVKAQPSSDYTPGKVYKTIESKDPDFAHRVQGNDIGATWGIVEDGDGGYEVNVSKNNTFWASFIPFVED